MSLRSDLQIFSVLVVVVLVIFVVCRRESRRRRLQHRIARASRSRLGKSGVFNAASWRAEGAGIPPVDYHRPADIQLADARILPPPRAIRGHIGE